MAELANAFGGTPSARGEPCVAYRFRTARLNARCLGPDDAPLVRAALDENDAHLRPWIPWMRTEPMSLEGTMQKLRGTRAAFDSDMDFRYGLFLPDDPRVVGEVSLLGRAGPGALEIGYWVDHRLAGQGLATEAAGAVIRIAFELRHIGRVEIHHDPENTASGAVPRKLGFTPEGTLRRRARDGADRLRDMAVWTLLADEYAATPARGFELHAWDALGAELALAAVP